MLLDNAERLGVLLARSRNDSGNTEPVRVSRANIGKSNNYNKFYCSLMLKS